jgi:hypothetical protein
MSEVFEPRPARPRTEATPKRAQRKIDKILRDLQDIEDPAQRLQNVGVVLMRPEVGREVEVTFRQSQRGESRRRRRR